MAGVSGSAQRTVEWTRNNRGAGGNRIARWTRQAGFSGFVQWCGIFLGSALKAQGVKPPRGYAAATNWSNFGSNVGTNIGNAQPGDILVYGTHHVAMYLGNGRQIQGNDQDGTVGESGVGSSLGLGPITAIRRPPYRGPNGGFQVPLSPAERRKVQREAKEENLGEGFLPGPGDVASEVVGGILGDLADHAEPLMLNIGLIGGGAFLIYYGAALMLGVKTPAKDLAKASAEGPAGVAGFKPPKGVVP